MANSSKRKGDRAEREAVAVLFRLAPDLVVTRPQRLLGAGRREDTGDLWVFPRVTVQVKYRSDPSTALRPAADGAAVQALRAGSQLAVGLVPLPGVRRPAVRWVACALAWPGGPPPDACGFRSVAPALHHVRRDDGPVPRTDRVAVVERVGTAALFLAPVEAWIDAYRAAVTAPAGEPPRTR